eukprot:s585_g22.t1
MCVPQPLCRSGEAFQVTRLTKGLVDSLNNTCEAGQAMLVHGHTELARGSISKWVKFSLRWTSAEAVPPAKCKVKPDPEHFSLTSWCATTPGQPLCSSQIVYTVTSRNTSLYACDGCKAPEHALTEFRGSRCGYDLIRWESLTVSAGSQNACTCNLSLNCSELPAEELPRACIHFAEPAVLSYGDAKKDDKAFLIFYDTGELLATSSADAEDRLGAIFAHSTWLSDGQNLLVKDQKQKGGLWRGHAAGSYFRTAAGWLQARMVLPEWWKVKFAQEAALPGSFNTDKLAGCEFLFKSNNWCYSARLGQAVWVAPAQGDCQDVAKAKSSIAYKYRSSAFGMQTYRSDVTCYPTAAFEEILVQVVDVGMPTEEFDYMVASSPCRTMIRYMTDASSKLSGCRSFFK